MRGKSDEQRLTGLFRALSEADRRTLLAFAEFLAAGTAAPAPPPPQHTATPEPGPPGETVIAAIRRLSRSYDLPDRGPLLHAASALMTAHVVQGRDAAAVIDDLEALFRRHHEAYRASLQTVAADAATADGPD
jgi:hypothetical protein